MEETIYISFQAMIDELQADIDALVETGKGATNAYKPELRKRYHIKLATLQLLLEVRDANVEYERWKLQTLKELAHVGHSDDQSDDSKEEADVPELSAVC